MQTSSEPNLLLPRATEEPVVWRPVGGEADHLPSEGGRRLELFVGGADAFDEQRLPVAGRYEHEGELLRFRPAFGLVAAQDYVVRTRRPGETFRLTGFRIPREAAAAPALVTEVYPSGDVLPENVLRFYVHFSVPMAPHLASDFIRLRDTSGRADPAAFMRFKHELWNSDRTRLTVLIDPGRIKRSVATNLDLGPVLLEGRRYALTIDEGWPSADGSSTLPAFSKSFRVGRALRERPDIEGWAWESPRPGTRERYVITFDRPFDRHLLPDAIHVVARDGLRVDGTPHIDRDETSWSFTPDEPWPAGEVRITVEDSFEDVAGNNFREVLDRRIGTAEAMAAPRTTSPPTTTATLLLLDPQRRRPRSGATNDAHVVRGSCTSTATDCPVDDKGVWQIMSC